MKKYQLILADICFPDYWGGHHLPHLSVPVGCQSNLGEVKGALLCELNMGAWAGCLLDHELFEGYDLTEEGYILVQEAVNNLQGFDLNLHHSDDSDYNLFAYFVLIEA